MMGRKLDNEHYRSSRVNLTKKDLLSNGYNSAKTARTMGAFTHSIFAWFVR